MNPELRNSLRLSYVFEESQLSIQNPEITHLSTSSMLSKTVPFMRAPPGWFLYYKSYILSLKSKPWTALQVQLRLSLGGGRKLESNRSANLFAAP